MGTKRTAIWLVCGVVPLAVLWAVLLAEPADRSAERATARALSAQLDGDLAARAAVVVALAERFSHWESLPPAAVLDALRAAATRHLSLRRLLVADPAGRLVAGYDADRPPGREGLPPGSLDTVLGRRQALRSDAYVVTSRVQAGTVRRLELAAPIRRTDGTCLGYVGASVSLDATRQRLRRLAASGLQVRVEDSQGALVFPCQGAPPARGSTVRSHRFAVTVTQPHRSRRWPAVLASALALAILLGGLGLLRILDRRP